MWMLIIFAYWQGPAIEHVPFKTQEACIAAAAQVQKKETLVVSIKTLCVYQGD